MSTTNEAMRRISTRGGAKERMAEVIKRVRTGGIAAEEPSGGDIAMGLTNNEGKGTEDTQPTMQKQANAARVAKKKPSKKDKTTKSQATAKESSASKKVDVIKLAELEDKHLKAHKAASSLHPRHWTGEVPGEHAPWYRH